MSANDEIYEAFKCCHDLKELKRAYMALIKKFHPDKGGSVEACQEVNSLYEMFEKRMQKPGTTEGGTTASESTADEWELSPTFKEVILTLVGLPGLELEICGSWLWATGDTWSNRAQLKAAGMKFASKKKAWFYHETEWHRKGKMLDMDEIREHHGSEKIKGEKRQQIA